MKKILFGTLALLMLVSFGSRAAPQDQASSASLKETLDFIDQMVKINGSWLPLTDKSREGGVLTDTNEFTATNKCDAKVTEDEEYGDKDSLGLHLVARAWTFKLSDLDPVSVKVETGTRAGNYLSFNTPLHYSTEKGNRILAYCSV